MVRPGLFGRLRRRPDAAIAELGRTSDAASVEQRRRAAPRGSKSGGDAIRRAPVVKLREDAFDEANDGESLAPSGGKQMRESEAVARVFFCEDACFGGSPLSEIVRDAHCEPIALRGDDDLEAALDALIPPPELMILPICPDGEEILEVVRGRPWLRMVPILALSPPHPSHLHLSPLP